VECAAKGARESDNFENCRQGLCEPSRSKIYIETVRGQGCYLALNKIRIISEHDTILVTQFSKFQVIPDEGVS
jgi:hypothetical protein